MVSINIHLRKTTDSQHGLLSSLLKYPDDGRLVVKYTDGDVVIEQQAWQPTDIYRFHSYHDKKGQPPHILGVFFVLGGFVLGTPTITSQE